MATTTNYGWETPDDTDLVKDGAAAIRTLGSSIDTTTKNLNPETTTGDIAYRSATANTNTRLPIGTTGQVLTVAGGVPSWATPTDETPLTTKGDLFTFSTVDARLGVGANGTVLTADSAEATGLKWAAPAGGATFSGARVTKSAVQSLSNDTDTISTFNTETFDVDGYHDNSVNNSRLTIPTGKTGYFLIVAQNTWAANTTGTRNMRIKKNGSTYIAASESPANVSSFNKADTISSIAYLVATDYVEVEVYQNSGGSLNVNSGDGVTFFAITYLGA